MCHILERRQKPGRRKSKIQKFYSPWVTYYYYSFLKYSLSRSSLPSAKACIHSNNPLSCIIISAIESHESFRRAQRATPRTSRFYLIEFSSVGKKPRGGPAFVSFVRENDSCFRRSFLGRPAALGRRGHAPEIKCPLRYKCLYIYVCDLLPRGREFQV